MTNSLIENIIYDYKNDQESVYQTWFLNNEDRLKAFRTIKSGINDVIHSIECRSFGNDFKGSPLEIVITAISEQKQVFEGASHAFFWKPKLRIPDIYENETNQLAFGRFLKSCTQASTEKQIIEEIAKLDKIQIKGLGPAVANILYFLHPTLFPPFNTAIVNGFNFLFNRKIKLGSWTQYLEMRESILDFNDKHRSTFSKDLGSVAGLLFEIGSERIVIPENAEHVMKLDLNSKGDKSRKKRHKEVIEDLEEANEHSEMQYHLARLGASLGYNVWIAQNDHKREWNNKKLGEFSLPSLVLKDVPKPVLDTVALIDVIWLDHNHGIVSAFEVEKSTSIYSGILRLQDLSLSLQANSNRFYLVAPDKREKEIKAQLLRPSFCQTVFLFRICCFLIFGVIVMLCVNSGITVLS
ncbi:hypothetical protein [Paenibacillus alginolyticus]|uniref:Type II restriction endonuclease n=1 Tax=Paenibacillus alginolyticus TaxID=59839 RepID=A0ABT4GB23_9BACL|nr:hypothetical protein [Paenibacillus alginolyticus]MCY9693386.1 hypothetical protein [Paenibacillus alginolyticus]MEC0144645.1 hypothetical protein [Paenibacillus alginolyticus]